MLDEFDAEDALARLLLPETPVLLDTTLEQLLHEADVCPHQPADAQSNIQQEQTPQELHQLPQELNAKFARTVKILEERREPRVQHAVLVLCQADQACCPPHSPPEECGGQQAKFWRSGGSHVCNMLCLCCVRLIRPVVLHIVLPILREESSQIQRQ